MKIDDICIKAADYAQFLIMHLGLEDASLYVDVMKNHINSNQEVFNRLVSTCVDDFNEIKNENSNGQTRIE